MCEEKATNEKIIIYRLRKGMTQGELARRIGMHRVTINRIENNGTTDLNIIEKVAKVLGVKVMDLRGD